MRKKWSFGQIFCRPKFRCIANRNLSEHTKQKKCSCCRCCAAPCVHICSLLREFQWLSHMPITGKLDGATLEKMASPRCGVKDARSLSAWGQRVNSIFTGHEQHLRQKRNIVSGMHTLNAFMCIRIYNTF